MLRSASTQLWFGVVGLCGGAELASLWMWLMRWTCSRHERGWEVQSSNLCSSDLYIKELRNRAVLSCASRFML